MKSAERRNDGSKKNAVMGLLLAAGVVCALLLSYLPGTPDVPDYWLRWTESMRVNGLSQGYLLVHADYPPGAFATLHAVRALSVYIGESNEVVLKFVITGFALAGTLVYFFMTRHWVNTTAFLFALLMNASAHGYLDAFALPAFLLALWLIKAGRIGWGTACYTVAVLMKWQPLVIAPFLIIYSLKSTGSLTAFSTLRQTLLRVMAGAAPVLLLVAVCFPPTAVLEALRHALTSHHALSFQGLNLNWIIQLIIYQAKHLVSVPYFDVVPPASLILVVKGIFWLCYAGILWQFIRRGRTFIDLLYSACLGYCSYFFLNTGVHENHLFLGMVLGFLLLSAHPEVGAGIGPYLAFAANANLLVFYGITGRAPLPYGPWITGALSALNMGFFLFSLRGFFRDGALGQPHTAPSITAPSTA